MTHYRKGVTGMYFIGLSPLMGRAITGRLAKTGARKSFAQAVSREKTGFAGGASAEGVPKYGFSMHPFRFLSGRPSDSFPGLR